jgi:hypothetical protein
MVKDLLITSLVYKNQATSSLISRPLFTDYVPVKAIFCIFPQQIISRIKLSVRVIDEY